MDQLSYSAAWLSHWHDEITDAVSSMISTFEETFGYEPGTNEVRAADDEDLGLPVTTVGSSWDSGSADVLRLDR
ncbi:hypothetical protein [Kitasatospora sp. NPDC057936]|uniref:hypothetical protein n=1 Tax=Kitasatospora sp. NPDC057936 TaxID=3346283 RepID=UPI0036DB2230